MSCRPGGAPNAGPPTSCRATHASTSWGPRSETASTLPCRLTVTTPLASQQKAPSRRRTPRRGRRRGAIPRVWPCRGVRVLVRACAWRPFYARRRPRGGLQDTERGTMTVDACARLEPDVRPKEAPPRSRLDRDRGESCLRGSVRVARLHGPHGGAASHGVCSRPGICVPVGVRVRFPELRYARPRRRSWWPRRPGSEAVLLPAARERRWLLPRRLRRVGRGREPSPTRRTDPASLPASLVRRSRVQRFVVQPVHGRERHVPLTKDAPWWRLTPSCAEGFSRHPAAKRRVSPL
jgi:hypothetical protein